MLCLSPFLTVGLLHLWFALSFGPANLTDLLRHCTPNDSASMIHRFAINDQKDLRSIDFQRQRPHAGAKPFLASSRESPPFVSAIHKSQRASSSAVLQRSNTTELPSGEMLNLRANSSFKFVTCVSRFVAKSYRKIFAESRISVTVE